MIKQLGTPSLANSSERPSCAFDFLAIGCTLVHPKLVAKTWANLLPLLDLTADSSVSVKTSALILRYLICLSLVRNRRDSIGLATVLMPLCVVTCKVCFAASRLILQFLASRSAVRKPFLLDVVVLLTLTFSFSILAKSVSTRHGSISIRAAAHWMSQLDGV